MTGWLLAHASMILGFLLAFALAGRIVRERRPPAAALAWLLAIVLVPWIGVPAYLILARRSAENPGAARPQPTASGADLSEPVGASDRLLRLYRIAPACSGNQVRLCATGEEGYRALIGLIDSARTRIGITMFILHPDEVGREVVARLARRAAEGIEVRLLLDRLGSFSTRAEILAPLVEAGGRVAMFGPLVRGVLQGRTNYRNHRKAIVVDGTRALSGGINIASEYIGPAARPDRWKDLAFVVEGPAAARIEEIVASDWLDATGERVEVSLPGSAGSGSSVQIVPSGPDVPGDALYATILSAAFAARKRLWAVTPYFVPDDALSRAFALAAGRGVDVRVLVPAVSNHRLADLARGTYLREIQAAGAHVLLFPEGMVHAKALVADDDFAMIGSTNLDLRSLRLNYELSMLCYGQTEIDATADWFDSLAGHCREGVRRPGIGMETLEGLARVAAPLL